MMLTVIKRLEKETIIYNPAVFVENEDKIVFPLEFYDETVQSLKVAGR